MSNYKCNQAKTQNEEENKFRNKKIKIFRIEFFTNRYLITDASKNERFQKHYL